MYQLEGSKVKKICLCFTFEIDFGPSQMALWAHPLDIKVQIKI